MNKFKRIVFLRGLGRSTFHWGEFKTLFQTLYPNILAEYLEIPGNGILSKLATPTDPAEVISFLRSSSPFCQEKVSFHICGISLGGMLALEWARLYPDDVEGLTVINSSVTDGTPFYRRLRFESYLPILAAGFEQTAEGREERILKITSNIPERRQKYLPHFSEFAERHPVSLQNLYRQVRLARRVSLAPLTVPLHVISSDHDALVHPSCSRILARALRVKHSTHPSAGHDLPLDDPQWLIRVLVTAT